MRWCTDLARVCPRGQAARSDGVGKGASETAQVAQPGDAPSPTLHSLRRLTGHCQERLFDSRDAGCGHQLPRRGVGQHLALVHHDNPGGIADRVAPMRRAIPCRPAWNRRLEVTDSSRSSVGCWNTMPSRANAGTAFRVMSWPITSMRPESGTKSPERSWNKVDLPAPLGPSRAMNSPGRATKLTPSTARIGP